MYLTVYGWFKPQNQLLKIGQHPSHCIALDDRAIFRNTRVRCAAINKAITPEKRINVKKIRAKFRVRAAARISAAPARP